VAFADLLLAVQPDVEPVPEQDPLVQTLAGADLTADGVSVGQFPSGLDGVGAEYSATLCDLGVSIDEATESISSDDLDVGVDGVG
jgi:hypothetical protein